MTTEHHDHSLTAAERAALVRVVDVDPSEGFADRVMAAWDVERAGEGVREIGGSRKATVIAIATAVLAAAAVLALWVRAHAGARDPAGERAGAMADATEVRAQARAVLAAHCTPCHDAKAKDADAAALRVFDLSMDDWWSMPSTDALPAMNDRMAGRSEGDRDRVAAFVDDELRRRAGAG